MVMKFVGQLMKINDLYEENRFLTDKDEIFIWMKRSFTVFDPNKLTIESDGLVYDGDLKLKKDIDGLKVKFKSVTGDFNYYGTKVSSLEFCPEVIGGYFNCCHTNITTLKYCPQSINSTFYCNNTNIDSLKYCPRLIGEAFYLFGCKITDPREYRYALYSEIGSKFMSDNVEIDNIINTYFGSANKKYWPNAINLLSKVKL